MSKKLGIIWVVPFMGFALGYFGTYLFVQTSSVIAPNVIGKNMQESAELLSKQRLGLRLLREQEDLSMPEGILMDQFPRPGQKIRPNQDIFVTVSKKPKMFQTPDFVCLKYNDILSRAAKYGIDTNCIFVYSTYQQNICFAQCPNAGSELSKRRVSVCISKGQFPLMIMPNFKGHSVSEVKPFISKFNIQLDLISTTTLSDSELVVDQSPIAGSIISFDKPVQIQLQLGE